MIAFLLGTVAHEQGDMTVSHSDGIRGYVLRDRTEGLWEEVAGPKNIAAVQMRASSQQLSVAKLRTSKTGVRRK